MAIKAYYGEEIYFDGEKNYYLTEPLEEQIRTLLSKNCGVGIIGGTYTAGLPICFISDLTLDMLHYDSIADYEYHTGNRLLSMIAPESREADCFHNGHVPIMLLFGDKDSIFGTDNLNPLPSESSDIGNFIRFLIREYRLNDTPKQYTCTPIHYYIWENQLGTPMLKIGIVHDMPHANYAEESRIAYDEYFSRFSRVNGTLLYLGAPAEI